MSEKIQTVNVIEFNQGCYERLVSFNDNEKGNKEAEKLFAKCIRKNWAEHYEGDKAKPTKVDIDTCLDNGTYENGQGYECYISHSE